MILGSFETLVRNQFKKDEDLERDPTTSASKCLQEFFQKGGTIQCISSLIEPTSSIASFNV